jgi:hypothetical protein
MNIWDDLLPLVTVGRSDRSLARSAWDKANSNGPSRRVRSDSRDMRTESIIGVVSLKKHGAHFDAKYL